MGTDYNRAEGTDYKSAPPFGGELGEANRPKGARRRQIRASYLSVKQKKEITRSFTEYSQSYTENRRICENISI
jgi:hypothetical protein